MILFPAIDLKGGVCVRLVRGDMGEVTVFNEDPADQVRRFVGQGCQWLHVVDLDGAVAGRSVNRQVIAAILETTAVPIQLGGGIRARADIESWLEAGVSRVILGTIAVRDPDLVRSACRAYPGRIAIGIDARAGRVAVEGWAQTSSMTALDLALRLEDAGAAAIIFTDIDRDGALGGVNVEATVELAWALQTPVIASGGVASLDDITALKAEADSGITGVIVGRALYDGRIELAAAMRILAGVKPC